MSEEQTIKAIPTKYKGYKFRSRLEARWAVFLDTLSVEWEYEKEGYNLGDGLCYLPDFCLPKVKCWLEVKGQAINPYDETWRKAVMLARMGSELLNVDGDHYQQGCVYVFSGQFDVPNNLFGLCFTGVNHYCKEDEANWLQEYGDTHDFEPYRCWWFQCPVCRSWQIGPHIYDLPCSCLDCVAPDDQMKLVEAVSKAKQARFEHGESG